MEWVSTVWEWLLDENNRGVLGFIGAGVAAGIAAGWALWALGRWLITKRRGDKAPPKPTILPRWNLAVLGGSM